MENTIALKLKALNYSVEQKAMINKFIASLSDYVISVEELVRIINFLAEKGITLKPSCQSILSRGFSYVEKIVNEVESLGELKAFIDDPARINSPFFAKRIEYMKSVNEPYKNEEGKYSKLLSSKRLFEKKFGVINFANINEVKDINTENLYVDSSAAINNNDTPNEPVQEAIVETVGENVDPLTEILSKPQTIGLNDQTFERYETLVDSLRHIMMSVYGIEEVNDSIVDNLIKLVTNEVPDDKTILFASITYGKSLTDEETQRLINAIQEELEYTSILDINIGRTA